MRDYIQPLQIEDVPVPDIGSADVFVKVAATSMCHSVSTLGLDDVSDNLDALAPRRRRGAPRGGLRLTR